VQDSRDTAYDGALPFRRWRRRIGDGSAFDLCCDLARRAAAHPVERGIAGQILKSKDQERASGSLLRAGAGSHQNAQK
jgi:hypothetical protein